MLSYRGIVALRRAMLSLATTLTILPSAAVFANDSCSLVTSDYGGINGTTASDAFDSDLTTSFQSAYSGSAFQCLTCDFGSSKRISYVTRRLHSATNQLFGNKSQAEYWMTSPDGLNFYHVNAYTSTGWESYTNFGLFGMFWRDVNRGTSYDLFIHQWIPFPPGDLVPYYSRALRYCWEAESSGEGITEVDIFFWPLVGPI